MYEELTNAKQMRKARKRTGYRIMISYLETDRFMYTVVCNDKVITQWSFPVRDIADIDKQSGYILFHMRNRAFNTAPWKFSMEHYNRFRVASLFINSKLHIVVTFDPNTVNGTTKSEIAKALSKIKMFDAISAF